MCLSANYAHHETHCMYITLQKQVDCFKHRVVTLVADKLERQWLLEVCFGIKTNCKKQPKGQLPSSSYNHDRVKSFITSVLPTLVYKFLMANLKCICNDSFTDVSVLRFDELGSWLMELLVAHQIFCYLQYGKAGTVCYIIIQPTFSHPRNYCSTSLLSSISQHNCASYTTPLT